MTVEGRTGKGIAVGYPVILPLFVDLFQGHPTIPAQRIHQPDILGKNERWFHIVNRFAISYIQRWNLPSTTKITINCIIQWYSLYNKGKKPDVPWRSSSGKRRAVRSERPVSNALHPAGSQKRSLRLTPVLIPRVLFLVLVVILLGELLAHPLAVGDGS